MRAEKFSTGTTSYANVYTHSQPPAVSAAPDALRPLAGARRYRRQTISRVGQVSGILPSTRRCYPEQRFGTTVNKLIDTGAVAAAYCVADESIDAFRRFHAALYAQQPEETATVFPDNGRLSSTPLAPAASAFVIVRSARRLRSRRRSTSRASTVAATTDHRWFHGSNARATTPPAGDLGRSP